MNIIICGAGEVGRHAAEVLGESGHNDITIIDCDRDKLQLLEEMMDVQTLHGSGTQGEVLLEAGCDTADLFIAATNIDEINLLAATLAKGVGAHQTIARVHHSAYFEKRGLDYAKYLGIDHLVCPEYTTALAIAQTLRSPGALAVERFAKGRIEMQALSVEEDAPARGKGLMELALPRSARVAAIERDGKAFIPDRTTVIQLGDIVTLVGEVDSFEKTRRLFHTHPVGRQRIMIMGGTPLAVWLCRALHTSDFSIRLFEKNQERAEELAAKLEWVTVLTDDPAEADTLQEERIDQTDAFVAVTQDDEHNILAAARAKSLGAKLAIAMLQRSTYLHLLEHVGIDRAFSPRVTAVAEIQHLVDESPVKRLASLAEDIADVYELRVPAAARDVIGKPLSEIKLPEKTLLAAIQHGEEVRIPGAADTLAIGDTLVIIAPAGSKQQLMKTFAIK